MIIYFLFLWSLGNKYFPFLSILVMENVTAFFFFFFEESILTSSRCKEKLDFQ